MSTKTSTILSALLMAGVGVSAAHGATQNTSNAPTKAKAMGLRVEVPAKDLERCYGIARKDMNNCATAKHGCYGYAKTNGAPDEYVLVAKGTCMRIPGGSLTAITGKPSKKDQAFMKEVTYKNGKLDYAKLDAMRPDIPASKIELCYGIAKKGMNDCANATHSCAHQAKTSGSPNEYIHTIRGTCKQIVGSVRSALPDLDG